MISEAPPPPSKTPHEQKVIEGFDAFDERAPFNDLADDIVGVDYKTGPAIPYQFDGVRLSETKGAHKS